MPTAAMQEKSALQVVFGAMTFGVEGRNQVRVHDKKVAASILDAWQAHGHKEIDTARVYGGGSSEEMLGDLDWQKRGIIMDTKLYPFKSLGLTHKPEDVRKHLQASLDALKTDKIHAFYLHGPDRENPFEDTLREVDALHKEGKFERFGVSNYRADEVDELVSISKKNGWIQPTMYQGLYNCLHRGVEPELFPVMRKHGISLFAFNPLGGGLITGRYKSLDEPTDDKGSRFDPNTSQGENYRKRYFKDEYFKALQDLQKVAEAEGLTMPEIALRWMSHHSMMKREHGDAVIIGASSLNHIEQNLLDLEKGPLPQSVVDALDKAWETVKPAAAPYHH